MERELTCIVCPMGCTIKVEMSKDRQVLNVTGNRCKRGEKYAASECTDPQRTITTTLRCENGSLVSVKTDRTIPKDKMLEAMQRMSGVRIKLPVKIGDILIRDVFGSNVVATQNCEQDFCSVKKLL